MEQNQANANPTPNPAQPFGAPVASEKKPTGLIIACVVLAISTVAATSFALFELTQNTSKSAQISDLKVQVETAEGKLATLETETIELTSPDGTKTTIASSPISVKNPIYIKRDENYIDSIYFQATHYKNIQDSSSRETIEISAENGEITRCYLRPENSHNTQEECSITGLSGKISAIYYARLGQGIGDESILFLMEDGTVEYIPARKAWSSRDFSSRGKIANLSGVVGFDQISVGAIGGGGYIDTAFRKTDGTYQVYGDLIESMNVRE